MKTPILTALLFAIFSFSHGQEKLLFFQTNWGNTLSWDTFCKKAKIDGYDGIEIWLPKDNQSRAELRSALEKYDLLVGFLNGTNKSISFEESLKLFEAHFDTLLAWKPTYINCHTGSDFFTIEQNKAFLLIANNLGEEHGVPVYHETHRGRFSYNLPETRDYLKMLPGLKLTLDVSHWMVVHESLLTAQDKELEEVLNRSFHIHARVGHAEGPQVSDPQAPEWKTALNRHLDIWEKVIRKKWSEGQEIFTITTEFGPPNYLPALPYTQIPVADQWKANVFIMETLKKRMYGN